jgi:hypothetical protein
VVELCSKRSYDEFEAKLGQIDESGASMSCSLQTNVASMGLGIVMTSGGISSLQNCHSAPSSKVGKPNDSLSRRLHPLILLFLEMSSVLRQWLLCHVSRELVTFMSNTFDNFHSKY